jgi:hypothetical protein
LFVSSLSGDCGQSLARVAGAFGVLALTWAAWPMKARVA